MHVFVVSAFVPWKINKETFCIRGLVYRTEKTYKLNIQGGLVFFKRSDTSFLYNSLTKPF